MDRPLLPYVSLYFIRKKYSPIQKKGNIDPIRAVFHRVVRGIFQELNAELSITKDCLEDLHEATELYLVQLFEDAYRFAVHRGRVTLEGSVWNQQFRRIPQSESPEVLESS